jgi:hypothetical protein
MNATIVNGGWAFGVGHDIGDPTRIAGMPKGAKVRVRQRAEDFVMVYVRTERSIEQWALRKGKDGWFLDHLHGRTTW